MDSININVLYNFQNKFILFKKSYWMVHKVTKNKRLKMIENDSGVDTMRFMARTMDKLKLNGKENRKIWEK